MKNLHLVPEQIQSLANGLLQETTRSEIRENYAQRLEAIRDFCADCLGKYDVSKKVSKKLAKKVSPWSA